MSNRFKEAFDSLRSDDKLKRERLERVISAQNAEKRKAATSGAENKSSGAPFFKSRRGIALLTAMAVFVSAAAITLPILIGNGTFFNGFPGRSTAVTRQFQAEIGERVTNGFDMYLTSSVTMRDTTVKVEESLSFNQGSNDFDFSLCSGEPVNSYTYLFAREGYLFSDETTSPRTSGFDGVTLEYLGDSSSSPIKNLDISEVLPLDNLNNLSDSFSDTEDFTSEIKALLAFGDFMGCVSVDDNVSTLNFQKMFYYFAHDFYDISKTIDENTTYQDLKENKIESRYREFFAENFPDEKSFEFFHEFLSFLGSSAKIKLDTRMASVFGKNWRSSLDKMLENTTETKFKVQTLNTTITITDLICTVSMGKPDGKIILSLSGKVRSSVSGESVLVDLSMNLTTSPDPVTLTDLSAANVIVSALSTDERLNSTGGGGLHGMVVPEWYCVQELIIDTYTDDIKREQLTLGYMEWDKENFNNLIVRKHTSSTSAAFFNYYPSYFDTYYSCTVQEGNIITVPVGDEERSYHLVITEEGNNFYLAAYAIGEGGVETQKYNRALLDNYKNCEIYLIFENLELAGLRLEYTNYSVEDGKLIREKVLLNSEYSPETHILTFDNGYGELIRWKMETYESGDPMLSRMLIIDGYDVDNPEVTTYHNYISHAYDPTPTPLYEAIALIKNYNESIT